MFGFVRESADGVFDVGRGKGFESGFVAPGEKLGESGAGGDGSGAAAHFKGGLDNAPVLYHGRKPQNVAADGVGDFERDGGRWELTDVTWIPKVIEKLRRH